MIKSISFDRSWYMDRTANSKFERFIGYTSKRKAVLTGLT